MTNTDLIIEFDLLYNNALSGSAPSLNNYEKSLFLTQAQEDIIRNSYENKGLNLGYEQSEKIRRRLDNLVITDNSLYSTDLNDSLASIKLDSNSKFFEIKETVWYIVLEQARTATNNFKIIPTTHDDYSNKSDSPFKKPNKRKAWRIDVKNSLTATKVVEVISTETLTSYYYRYLSEPTPIVLTDLSEGEFEGMGLSINSVTVATETILPSETHRLTLKRAVDLATVAYKENTLSNNVQINN